MTQAFDYKRWRSARELLEVVRYEWSVRRVWPTRRAAVRGLWHALIRRYAFELCQRCGGRVGRSIGETFWRASNELWESVNGSPGGTLCPRCFTAQAEAKGVRIHWEAVPDK